MGDEDYDINFPHNESKRLRERKEREIELLDTMSQAPRSFWFRPMDLGGKDGSHHHHTLKRLVAQGFAEKKERGGHTRPAYAYRATKYGRALIRKMKK